MKNLNFALIGAGKFGKNYLRLLQNTPGITLQAVITKDSTRPKDLPLSIEHSANLEQVLKNPEIDCVVIVTPPATHFKLAKAALVTGKHVLLEKPMTVNLKEAGELKKIVENSGKVFMVGFQYLFNNYIQYLKKEIEIGSFGKIIKINSEHFQSPPRDDVNAFWDAAPHPLSIFQFIFNPKKIIKVSGEQKNLESAGLKDYAQATVQFDRGPLLNITTSWPGKQKVRKLTVQGEKITAVLDETKTDGKLTLTDTAGNITTPKITAQEPLQAEMEHFIYSCSSFTPANLELCKLFKSD